MMDAGFISNVPLLCYCGDIQCNLCLYCYICLDDWIWKPFLLLHQEGIEPCTLYTDDVAAKFLCGILLYCS